MLFMERGQCQGTVATCSAGGPGPIPSAPPHSQEASSQGPASISISASNAATLGSDGTLVVQEVVFNGLLCH